MQPGSLRQIKYPTGGVTKFEYEANDYFKYQNYDFVPETLPTLSQSQTVSFSVPQTTFALINFSLSLIYSGYAHPGTLWQDFTLELQKADGTTVVRFEVDEPFLSGDSYSLSVPLCKALAPGNYKLVANNANYQYLTLTADTKLLRPKLTSKMYGGGLRIKSISNFESEINSQTPLSKKIFTYEENGKSTGKLLSDNDFFYDDTSLALSTISSSPPAGVIGVVTSSFNHGPTYPSAFIFKSESVFH